MERRRFPIERPRRRDDGNIRRRFSRFRKNTLRGKTANHRHRGRGHGVFPYGNRVEGFVGNPALLQGRRLDDDVKRRSARPGGTYRRDRSARPGRNELLSAPSGNRKLPRQLPYRRNDGLRLAHLQFVRMLIVEPRMTADTFTKSVILNETGNSPSPFFRLTSSRFEYTPSVPHGISVADSRHP